MVERGFEAYESSSAERAREFYRRVLEYLESEYEQRPELVEELSNFRDYVVLMLRLIPQQLPYTEREQQIERVHHEIEMTALPRLPVTLPPPSDRLAVGRHMLVTTNYSAATCWPDERQQVLQLSDGRVLTPETPMGKIDIVRNLPTLAPNANPLSFARELLSSSVESLTELAGMCERGDRRLAQVEAFGGVSHLARVGGRLGFTVFDIADGDQRSAATRISKGVAESVARNNRAWQELKANYKPARIAFISRMRLIKEFGSSAIR
jgi:hypothetical protein